MVTPVSTSAPPIGLGPLQQAQQLRADSMQRLATGNAINRAKDDPSGLMAGINLDAALRTLDAETRSLERETSVQATRDGALSSAGEMLADLKGLAVQAANTGAMSDAEREALDIEAASIVRAIEHTTDSASFAGEKLFDGSVADELGGVAVDENGGTNNYNLADVGRGLSLSGDAALIAQIADRAVGDLATMRGEIGAKVANGLGPRSRAIDAEATNLAEARSIIMDTDYASESASLSRSMLLSDSSLASLLIDNASSANVLNLLGGR
jgi:flagellin